MKANELRIGNYYQNGSEVICLKSLDIYENVIYEPIGLEPIPLTIEWLIMMGFDKKVKGEFCYEYYHNENEPNRFNCRFSFSPAGQFLFEYLIGVDTWPNIPVEYVHQLQNLFFAIGKKELKINLQND